MKTLLLACSVLLALSINAQSLQRSGSLGALIAPADNGVLIQEVLPGSTALSLELVAGDVIAKVGEKEPRTVEELVAITSQWKAGDLIKLSVERDGKLLTLSGTIQGKPLETARSGKVIYDEVPFDGGRMRSLLNLPEGAEKPPVVFFLQGFSCGSIDHYYDDRSRVRQLVDGLVDEGFAVYRVEKPGVGDSDGPKDCYDIGFLYEVDAFAASLRHLKTLEQIDVSRIYLFGHSLGGVTAPLIAANEPVHGIINYGSVSTSWFEYMVKHSRKQKIIFGDDLEEVERDAHVKFNFFLITY